MNLPYQLKEVIHCVTHLVPTEKIALIGYIDNDGKARSGFKKDKLPTTQIKAANILVITKDEQVKPVLQDRIEQKCKPYLPVSCTSHHVSEFITIGQRRCIFVNKVLSPDCIIYEEKKNPVEIPYVPAGPGFLEQQKKELGSWYEYAVDFLEMACSQHALGNNRMTAFCLHQAIEQLLVMLIQTETGYKMTTHNVPRLLRFLRFYNDDIADVFTANSEIEQESMRLLRETYITSRYRTDFCMADEHIQFLMREVFKLHTIAEKVMNAQSYGLLNL